MQSSLERKVSGVIVDHKDAVLVGLTVIARGASGEWRTTTNDVGQFCVDVPDESISLRIEGQYIKPQDVNLALKSPSEALRIEVDYSIPSIHESIAVTASALDPPLETHGDDVYKKTLFSRDDQLLETLNGGISAGQHEGGGKSLEIRRFGFNVDHGGVNGGLKVLVDDIQQNQGTQGHGQGYLGGLKALTPELIQDVNILNGPFSAEYGDFSGLGVVHIRLKESLPDEATIRLQGGSVGSYRTLLSYSPALDKSEAFLAYERARTDGPFDNPLRYQRDNITGNYTQQMGDNEAVGVKLNLGRNDFFSSGQIPLDVVASGQLSRFGYVDPNGGGRVRLGTADLYYRKTLKSGDSLKADAFLSRSLFDLYSNFTLFMNDPIHGDGIQQHDSRRQEGFNTQYLHPYRLWGNQALLTAGANFQDNQINVALYPQERRVPLGVETRALAHVTNTAGYVQQGADLLRGKLHIQAGLRWDFFRFSVDDRVNSAHSGLEGAARLQPKFGFAYRISKPVPVTLNFNYGRGINTQDARGIVQHPESSRIATTDFYQLGSSYHAGRLSLASDLFLIDRSNEQVYIPDDGTFELKGPSRSYGFEYKTSIRLTGFVSLNSGITQVRNSFYRGTAPRVYIDSAPHTVANAGLILSTWQGIYASLRYRRIGNYRLDGKDPGIRASGLDVIDLAVTKSVHHWIDFNIDVDNLTNKRYYETQNLFESRVSPVAEPRKRIHGTPGYPIGLTAGLTFHFAGKP